MQNETTYSGILGEWQRLQAAMSANTVDLTHLNESRLMFAELLNQAQAVIRRQAALAAEKQQHSQDLRTMVADGQRMATMLRQGLKQYYGIRSEKLVEFGLTPFRGKTGRKQRKGCQPIFEKKGKSEPRVALRGYKSAARLRLFCQIPAESL